MTTTNSRGLTKRYAFIWSSGIFVGLSLVAAALNYLYYPVIAHILPPSSFGAAQVLIAILLQVSAIFAGLNLVVIYLVHTLSDEDSRRAIETLQKITTGVFLVATVGLLLGRVWVAHFLHLDNQAYLFIVVLNLFTNVPFILTYGHLQAQKRFVAAGMLQITIVTTKLVLGALATKRWGVSGALLGFTLGQVIGLTIYWLVSQAAGLPSWGHSIWSSIRLPSQADLKFLRPWAGKISAIFVVNVILVLFISFDIISARHFFDANVSGLYAGASTVSNAIVFVCLPLIGVLLPHLHAEKLRHSRAALLKTFGMIIGIGVISVAALALVPNLLLGIFGSQYQAFSYLLWRMGVLMALLAVIILLLQVSAFYKPGRTAVICVAALAGMVALVAMHHSSPLNMVSTIMTGFAIIVVISLVQISQIYVKK